MALRAHGRVGRERSRSGRAAAGDQRARDERARGVPQHHVERRAHARARVPSRACRRRAGRGGERASARPRARRPSRRERLRRDRDGLAELREHDAEVEAEQVRGRPTAPSAAAAREQYAYAMTLPHVRKKIKRARARVAAQRRPACAACGRASRRPSTRPTLRSSTRSNRRASVCETRCRRGAAAPMRSGKMKSGPSTRSSRRRAAPTRRRRRVAERGRCRSRRACGRREEEKRGRARARERCSGKFLGESSARAVRATRHKVAAGSRAARAQADAAGRIEPAGAHHRAHRPAATMTHLPEPTAAAARSAAATRRARPRPPRRRPLLGRGVALSPAATSEIDERSSGSLKSLPRCSAPRSRRPAPPSAAAELPHRRVDEAPSGSAANCASAGSAIATNCRSSASLAGAVPALPSAGRRRRR